MAEPTDTEPTPAPGPTPWQRRQWPEPPEGSDAASVNGRVLMALLGAIASVVLGIAGYVDALDKHQGTSVPPPAGQNAQTVNPFKQPLGKNSPAADVLESVETKLVAVGKTVARIEANPNRDTKDFKSPDTAKLLADLRRVLDELQKQLAGLDSSKLNPEQQTKRDRYSARVEELRGKLATVSATG